MPEYRRPPSFGGMGKNLNMYCIDSSDLGPGPQYVPDPAKAEAQAKLALNKVPEGYYEFPAARVVNPSSPSKVEPYYGQPGGGVEITTDSPIDVSDIPFTPLGCE